MSFPALAIGCKLVPSLGMLLMISIKQIWPNEMPEGTVISKVISDLPLITNIAALL